MSTREQREQEIAFSDDDVITRMMEVLEYRWYVDTDRWSENTFEEDVRPLFEKMMKAEQPKQEAEIDAMVDAINLKIHHWTWGWVDWIRDIVLKHLTQKTTVPKDGEVKKFNK